MFSAKDHNVPPLVTGFDLLINCRNTPGDLMQHILKMICCRNTLLIATLQQAATHYVNDLLQHRGTAMHYVDDLMLPLAR